LTPDAVAQAVASAAPEVIVHELTALGARRFVAQSFGAFRFARTGGAAQTEAEPLDPNPPAALRTPLVGILHLERAVTTIEWGEGGSPPARRQRS
jgi:hypothetical protein